MAQNIVFFLYSRKLLQDSRSGDEGEEEGAEEETRDDDIDLDLATTQHDGEVTTVDEKAQANGETIENGKNSAETEAGNPIKKGIAGIMSKLDKKRESSKSRSNSSKAKKKAAKSDSCVGQVLKRKHLVFWGVILSIFAILTLWHWIEIIVANSKRGGMKQKPSYNHVKERISFTTTKMEMERMKEFRFPNTTLCFPLYLDYIPFTVHKVEPYTPRTVNWTAIDWGLDFVIGNITADTFYESQWFNNEGGVSLLITASAMLARLNQIETSEAQDYKTAPLSWEERFVSVTKEVVIDSAPKISSINKLVAFLNRTDKLDDLSLLANKVGLEYCKALALRVTLSQEKEFHYMERARMECENFSMTWVSRDATCFAIPTSDFVAKNSDHQVYFNIDLSHLYSEFLHFIPFYEQNYTLGEEGRLWYSQSTTLNLKADRRITHYFGTDVLTITPGYFKKYILEVDRLVEEDPEDTGCTDEAESLSECEDRCFAELMSSSCRNRCTPYFWRNQITQRKSKHCSIEDYNSCLRFNSTKSMKKTEMCRAKCEKPCTNTHYRVSLLDEGRIGANYFGGQVRLISGRLSYPKYSPQKIEKTISIKVPVMEGGKSFALTGHEVLGLLGGAANFWLGLSVAGLIHLAWFLFYEIPRIKRLEKEENTKKQPRGIPMGDLVNGGHINTSV